MLTCRQVAGLVTDNLEDALGSWQKLQFNVHILICRDCRIYLDKMRGLVRALGRIPRSTPGFEAALEKFRQL